MNIVNDLKDSDLFRDLDHKVIEKLAETAKSHTLTTKEILFHEGFDGSHFYILTNGAIRIFKTSYDGKESTIKIIREGEFFAEAILFGKKHYPASAIATTKSKVIAISKESFWEMLENEKSRNVFIASIFNKMRYLTEQIHRLTSYDVEDRFFNFLINNFGKHNSYNITIPKKDIASAIGTIPETFSRLVLRLSKMGIITWEKSILTIQEKFWDTYEIDE